MHWKTSPVWLFGQEPDKSFAEKLETLNRAPYCRRYFALRVYPYPVGNPRSFPNLPSLADVVCLECSIVICRYSVVLPKQKKETLPPPVLGEAACLPVLMYLPTYLHTGADCCFKLGLRSPTASTCVFNLGVPGESLPFSYPAIGHFSPTEKLSSSDFSCVSSDLPPFSAPAQFRKLSPSACSRKVCPPRCLLHTSPTGTPPPPTRPPFPPRQFGFLTFSILSIVMPLPSNQLDSSVFPGRTPFPVLPGATTQILSSPALPVNDTPSLATRPARMMELFGLPWTVTFLGTASPL